MTLVESLGLTSSAVQHVAVLVIWAGILLLIACGVGGVQLRRIRRMGKGGDPYWRDVSIVGSTVIAFQADGCMAHDHKFLWAGVIDRLEPSPMKNVPAGRYVDAVVRVCKRADNCYDSTDRDLGEERALVGGASPSLYRVAPGLYLYTK